MRRRRRSKPARGSVAAIVVGVALLVSAAVVWRVLPGPEVPGNAGRPGAAVALADLTTSPAPTGTGPTATTARTSPTASTARMTPAPASTRAATTAPTPKPPATSVPRSTPTSAPKAERPPKARPTSRSAPQARTAPPVQLRIDALGVDAPVVAVGVDEAGDMQVPKDVGEIGWYRFGAAPGAATGSVVLAGHVDSASQGIGVFHALWTIEPGTIIRVERQHGRPMTYRVVSRETFAKTEVPLAAIFATTGAPRLTLVTCGGAFDQGALSYQDNVVVTAEPT